jgi:hypothetical protein
MVLVKGEINPFSNETKTQFGDERKFHNKAMFLPFQKITYFSAKFKASFLFSFEKTFS